MTPYVDMSAVVSVTAAAFLVLHMLIGVWWRDTHLRDETPQSDVTGADGTRRVRATEGHSPLRT